MKRLYLLSLIAIPLLVVKSEEPVPTGFEHWTPTALQRATQALAADAGTDPHHFAVKQLSDFPNEAFLLVHREADGQVEWHETQGDVFFVQSGSATLIVGGTYLNEETVAPHEKRNGSIQCGARPQGSARNVVWISARVPPQLHIHVVTQITFIFI